MRPGRTQTGTNSYRYENFCSRLHETGTKCLVDYMRPVRAQKQHISEQYNLHNLACSRLRDSGEKSEEKTRAKKRAGAGERLGSGACKHFLNGLFRYTSSWYTLCLVRFDSQHQHLVVWIILVNQKDGCREVRA